MEDMSNYSAMEQALQEVLQSRSRPVAITFAAAPPEGVARRSKLIHEERLVTLRRDA
jgi:ribosomal protein S12 methylthiotransferase accessory factor YcaO